METISWAEPLRGGWGYGDWRALWLKRRERAGEIARPEGGERKAKAVSGRWAKDGGWLWVTQAQTGAGPPLREAIDQAATQRER